MNQTSQVVPNMPVAANYQPNGIPQMIQPGTSMPITNMYQGSMQQQYENPSITQGANHNFSQGFHNAALNPTVSPYMNN
jgi:hypothetical protein